MLKILHVLAQLPARTGSGIYYRNLLQGLQEYGHDQRALFARQDETLLEFLSVSRQYPVQFCSESLPFPIAGMSDIMPYPNTVYGQMDEAMLAQWQAAFREALLGATVDFTPQVIVLHHLWMLTALAVELFPTAVKIGICHNTDLRQAVQQPQLTRRYVTNLCCLDRVFALSEEQRSPIASLYGIEPEKITVLGGGFDQGLFYPAPPRPRSPEQPIELVYASKIDPAKGIYALLDAFRQVQAAYPQARLHVVGTADGENAPRLKAAVGGNPAIRCYPAMSQAALADFFRTMDLYVMPSFFEGLGLTALEALACGLSVVAAENRGLCQLLGDSLNESGCVAYVPLPLMEMVDRPCPEGLGAFTQELAEQIKGQISQIVRGEPRSSAVTAAIACHSWRGISAAANVEITRLCT